MFWSLKIWSFEFVSDFVFRVSNFPDKKQLKVSDIYLDLCMSGKKEVLCENSAG